jgi:hypothetical protein
MLRLVDKILSCFTTLHAVKSEFYNTNYQRTPALPEMLLWLSITDKIKTMDELIQDQYTDIIFFQKYVIIALMRYNVDLTKKNYKLNILEDDNKTAKNITNDRNEYALEGVIYHAGTSQTNGHYIFYAFENGKFSYSANDSKISTDLPPSRHINKGYIFLYKKVVK